MKNYIKKFIKDIIPVITGILIALFINNWSESAKEKRYLKKVFSSIDKELIASKEDIVRKLPEQQKLIDTLDTYMNNNNVTLLNTLVKGGGIHVASIKLHAWKSIASTKIDLIDYNKLTNFVSLEEEKEVLELKGDKLMDFLFLNADDTSSEKKSFVKAIMIDIMYNERSLKEKLTKMIQDK